MSLDCLLPGIEMIRAATRPHVTSVKKSTACEAGILFLDSSFLYWLYNDIFYFGFMAVTA